MRLGKFRARCKMCSQHGVTAENPTFCFLGFKSFELPQECSQ
jgi:hypothetical protein